MSSSEQQVPAKRSHPVRRIVIIAAIILLLIVTGTFAYYCDYHTEMIAQVTVVQ